MKRRGAAGKIILASVLAVLIISGAIYFTYAFFQVENIEVQGNGKYTDIYITGLASVPEKTHMFFLDIDSIVENIEQSEPYLEVQGVKKKYPQTVIIEVKERRPKALIAYADKYLLADDSANVLEILDFVPENNTYPILEGFAVSGVSLGRQIGTDDTFKITVMEEILTALENRQLTEAIYSIDLSDINNIRMVTADKLSIKFGQADKVADKIKWIDRMLPTLKRDGRTSGVLDVSAGTFATYKKDESESSAPQPVTGAVSLPSLAPSATQGAGLEEPQASHSGTEEPGTESSAQPAQGAAPETQADPSSAVNLE